MDNGHFFVSRGTNSHTLLTPAIYTDTVYLRAVYFPCNNHVLIVDILHCSNNDRFFKLVFPAFDLVLYSHLIFFFLLQTFHFLIGFSPQLLSLPSSPLSAIVFISIQHVSWTFFWESPLITAIRMIRTLRHFP